MKTTTTKQAGKRRKPRSASSTQKQPPAFVYNAARIAAEDKMDADWYEARRARTGKSTPPQPPGFQERIYRCNRCGVRTEYNMEFDSSFCRQCNRWVESKCSDPNCDICSKRPERPLPDA
jgi:hypothetical protein